MYRFISIIIDYVDNYVCTSSISGAAGSTLEQCDIRLTGVKRQNQAALVWARQTVPDSGTRR